MEGYKVDEPQEIQIKKSAAQDLDPHTGNSRIWWNKKKKKKTKLVCQSVSNDCSLTRQMERHVNPLDSFSRVQAQRKAFES